MHQIYNDLIVKIIKPNKNETNEIYGNETKDDFSIISFKNLVLISFSYCIYLDAFEMNKQILKNNKKRLHNHPEYQSLDNSSNEKIYTLVLDMDETLIHFFDVRFFKI